MSSSRSRRTTGSTQPERSSERAEQAGAGPALTSIRRGGPLRSEDSVGGKRLNEGIPISLDAVERYGHLRSKSWSLPRDGYGQHHDESATKADSGRRKIRTAQIGP